MDGILGWLVFLAIVFVGENLRRIERRLTELDRTLRDRLH